MAEMQVLILKVSESSNMKVGVNKFEKPVQIAKLNAFYWNSQQKSLEFAFGNGYGHGIMTSITNQLFKREFVDEELAENHLNFTRSPMILESFEWRYVTPVINVQNLSARNQEVAKNNELQFIQEMKFAYHVKDAGYILIKLGNNDPEVLGKQVKRLLKSTYDTRIVLEIPIVDSAVMNAAYRNDLPEDFEGQDQVCFHVFDKHIFEQRFI